MQKLTAVLNALDPARRTIVAAAAIATFLAVLLLAQGAGNPSLSLLYSGLAPSTAGEVVAALEQAGVRHEVRGDAIYVDTRQRDSLRMLLAAEGLPAPANSGYEILDNLSGFGTTAQMFDAAYWRAKEGELARTIQSNPRITAARVHISNPSAGPFDRGEEAKASVVVTAPGGLGGAQARALRFLVASAVRGLDAERVTVVDSADGLIGAEGDAAGNPGAPADRAEALRRNALRLLQARVGAGRAIVEVSVDTVTEREQIVERLLDPDSRVAISTVTEETNTTARDSRDGAVTVSSNLPDGEAGGSGADSSSQEANTREQVNYEVSETQREVIRAPGAVRRLSVAVLVDGVRAAGPDGTETWTPRTEDELDDLKALVASAVGFDAARGDVITLRSMEFPPLPEAGTEAPAPALLARLGVDAMQLVQIGALAAVALFLGLFVVRPVLTGAPPALPVPAPALDLPPPARDHSEAGPALDGEIDDRALPRMPVVSDAPSESASADAAPPDPAARLRELTDGRQSEAASVLRAWIEEREAPA